jgi:hypothetical protein
MGPGDLHPTTLSRANSAAPWSATVTSGEGSHAKAAWRVSFSLGGLIQVRGNSDEHQPYR